MTDNIKQTTDYYGLIEAYVEGYRGSRDASGFDACVRAEINKRFAELHDELWRWKEGELQP